MYINCFFCISRESWIKTIERHQADLRSVKTVQKHKAWFEYLEDTQQPKNSNFRCRLCYKYFDEMKLCKNSKPAFALAGGFKLKPNRKKNSDAINEHATAMSHLNIIALLKENVAKNSVSVFFQVNK